MMGVDGWVEVYRGERLQADLVAAILNASGIPAEVFGDTAYGAGINFTEARIMVPDSQAKEAIQLIRSGERKAPKGV